MYISILTLMRFSVSLPDLLEDNEELKVAHCSHKFKFGPGPEGVFLFLFMCKKLNTNNK